MMNWNYLGKYLNSGHFFAEFCDSLPAERIYQIETGSHQEWKCVLKTGPWCIEVNNEKKTARLVDRSSHRGVCDTEVALYADLKRFLQRRAGRDNTVKSKIALVLAGGGAKGAYQIGVWEALRQLGIYQQIGGIAGTSIGAVNAILIARGEYSYAKNLWLELSELSIRAENQRRINEICKRKPAALGELLLKDRFLSQTQLQTALSQAVSGGYGDKIKREYHIYATAVKKETWEENHPEATYIPCNLLSNAEIVKAALASSALPLVYNPVELKGNLYYDGGLKDNTPMEPLYQCGYRRFLVIHLHRDGPEVRAVCNKLRRRYDGCRTVHIVPGRAFEDNPAAMLKLTPEATLERIERGRSDAMALQDSLQQLSAG